MTETLYEQYQRVQSARATVGMEAETYETFLERRVTEGQKRLQELEEVVVIYLDATQNEQTFYRGDIGMGDEEIAAMQNRAIHNLKIVLENHGWSLLIHEDGIMRIKHQDGRHVYLGTLLRLIKE